MKKGMLFLALLLLVSVGGCDRGEDLKDTLTRGTWRVGSYVSDGDEDTSHFRGYVFTFLADGTVTVTRPDALPARGRWNEFSNDSRLDLEFREPGLLERLDEEWVVDRVWDDEILLHELGVPLSQLSFKQL